MSRTNTDQIIAHVDLLRSIDRLLMEVETVRRKREVLEQLLSVPADTNPIDTPNVRESRADAP
jgi:hypothetical protein